MKNAILFSLFFVAFFITSCKKEESNPVTPNPVEVEMITVQGGTFDMGGTISSNELPIHSITLSTFKIAKYEVTQKLWVAVMGSNPSLITGDENRPVEQVNWNDVQQFITKLNQLTGKNYRLPTEAEWEYAARGGNQSQGYTYAGSNDVNAVAWNPNNSGNVTHPVGTKSPNELGIYDMSGNVWEWCNDWYGETYYSISPSTNPPGPSSGTFRVWRGGSCHSSNDNCRSAYRSYGYPVSNYGYIGFRLALDL
ncbi:MAG TPA: SUMF1/EgtB/PvdO family nonheme iron enzyme [Melioribacteraceae bacterium]|nr:SUMF1/EgtB/PvdO family nonheme iron enzyme [Melioribacteraceae bacterium]